MELLLISILNEKISSYNLIKHQWPTYTKMKNKYLCVITIFSPLPFIVKKVYRGQRRGKNPSSELSRNIFCLFRNLRPRAWVSDSFFSLESWTCKLPLLTVLCTCVNREKKWNRYIEIETFSDITELPFKLISN